jgi:hypothetical protein
MRMTQIGLTREDAERTIREFNLKCDDFDERYELRDPANPDAGQIHPIFEQILSDIRILPRAGTIGEFDVELQRLVPEVKLD